MFSRVLIDGFLYKCSFQNIRELFAYHDAVRALSRESYDRKQKDSLQRQWEIERCLYVIGKRQSCLLCILSWQLASCVDKATP